MQSEQSHCQSAVVFLVYNRPEETRRVLKQIQLARPARFLVVADGPKTGSSRDRQLCEQVRSLIHEETNWDCTLSTLYSAGNQGCGKNISSGLDWAFSQVEEAIILEDDCLPDPTFFKYCDVLLNLYREDSRIAQICGYNGIDTFRKNIASSYFCSRFGPVWGWATWKRAWDLYDYSLEDWPTRSPDHWMKQYPGSTREKFWKKYIYSAVKDGIIDTWDYQWDYAKFKHRALSIIPSVNLIKNIGFGPNATHTRSVCEQAESNNIEFPLVHPDSIAPLVRYDKQLAESSTPSWVRLGGQLAKTMIFRGKNKR